MLSMVAKMEVDTPSYRQPQLMQKHFSQLVEQILQVRKILSLPLSLSPPPSLSLHFCLPHTHTLSPSLPQTLIFKIRFMHPCLLSNVRYDVNLPDDDEIQVPMVKCTGPVINYLDKSGHCGAMCHKFPLYVVL